MTIATAIKTASKIKTARAADIQKARLVLLDEVAACFDGTHDDATGAAIIDALNILTDKGAMAAKLTKGQSDGLATLQGAGSILWQWDGVKGRSTCTHKVSVATLTKLVQLGLAASVRKDNGRHFSITYKAA